MRTRTKIQVAVVSLLLACAGPVLAGEADFANCGICKPMMEEPGLMQHMNWASRPIATGMLSITTVDPEFEAAFVRAHEKMMDNVGRLEAGEEMDLCPVCAGMGRLHRAGATIENIDAAGTHVTVVTSDQPEVIEQIHALQHRMQARGDAAPEHGGEHLGHPDHGKRGG